jgi:hypothetical protein
VRPRCGASVFLRPIDPSGASESLRGAVLAAEQDSRSFGRVVPPAWLLGPTAPPTLAARPAGIDSGASAGTRMTGAVVVAGRLGSDYLAVRLIRSVGRGPNVVPPLPQSWRTRCVDRSARRLDECRSASVSSAPYLIFSIESGGSTAMSFRAMRAATLAGVEAGRMRPGEERAGRVVRRVGNVAASAKSTGSRHRQ